MSVLPFRRLARRRPAARHAGPAAPAPVISEVVKADASHWTAIEQLLAVPASVPQPEAGFLPGVCLRAVTPDGAQADIMLLAGPPCFTGTGVSRDGRRYAGVTLGTADGGYVTLDVPDYGWFDDLIAELATARDELYFGGIGYARVIGGAR